MGKFFLKIALLLSPFILFGIEFNPRVIDEGLRHTEGSPNYPEWNDIVDSKINADVLIQGNSRAWAHISPKLIDSAFHANSYNLGLDGYQFHMQYARFLLYLKFNKRPKYIIQVADYLTLGKRRDLYMCEQFIPFLKYKEISEAVVQYDGLDNRDTYIPFYKYIHKTKLLEMGCWSSVNNFPNYSYGKYKGFKANSSNWDKTFSAFKKANPNGYSSEIDTQAVRLFEKFIVYCKKQNIKLIFVNPPAYFESSKMLKNRAEIDSVYSAFSKKYSISYLNYTNDSICLDTLNFYNSQHLNITGVAKFNTKLIRDINGFMY